MTFVRLNIVAISACVLVGCVTEGAVERRPAPAEEQAEANLALGIGYLQEQRPDLAIEALRRAVAAQPRLADAHSMLAIAYDQTANTELAEEHHRRATQLAPRNADTQNSYAVFLCRRNRWSDAEPYFDAAAAAAPDAALPTVMINAANCARDGNDFDAAAGYFRRVLQRQPENPVALRGMIDVSIRSENFINGRAFWQRLAGSPAIEATDLLACYVIETELGDAGAAQACADRLRSEFPGSPALTRLRELERNAS